MIASVRRAKLGAARVRHDAEGAELVATFLHRQERLKRHRHVARLRQRVEFFLGGKIRFEDVAGLARELAIISGRR
jgi:hypothetical protein